MKAKFFLGLSIAAVSTVLTLGASELFLSYCRCIPIPVCQPSLGGIAHFAEAESGQMSFSCNVAGFRAGEFKTSKEADELRIAIVGDSHPFGAGLSDGQRVSDFLEQHLHERFPNRPISVYNFSQPGTTFPEQLEIIEQAITFQPDAVIWIPFVGNDFSEFRGLLDGGAFHNGELQPKQEKSTLKRQLGGSYLYHLLASTVSYVKLRLEGKEAESLLRIDNSGAGTQGLLQVVHFRERPVEMEETVVAYSTFLERINRKVTESGAEFVLAMLPTKMQVDSDVSIWPGAARERLAKIVEELGIAEQEADTFYRQLWDRLRQEDCRQNINSIDVLSFLRTESEMQPKYWPIDWHLNLHGHQLFADLLSRCILSQKQGIQTELIGHQPFCHVECGRDS